MDKKNIKKFLRWVVGNTVWEVVMRGIPILLSFIATWWLSAKPQVLEWLSEMNIPVIMAVIVMFLGFALIAWWILLAVAWSINKLTRKAPELYTTQGIEVTGFTPKDNDIRPAGILITNKKGTQISCAAQMEKFWQGKTRVFSFEAKSLVWYEDGFMKNYAYTLLEDNKPELIVLEHIPTEKERQIIPVTIQPDGDNRDWGKSVQLEGVSATVYEIESCTAEIQLFFTIKGLHLRPSPLRFRLSYDGNSLKVEKVTDWNVEERI